MIINNQPIHFRFCKLCDCVGQDCTGTNQIAEFTDSFSFQLNNEGQFLQNELLMDGTDWYGDFEDGTAINGGYWSDGGAADWAINAVNPLDGTTDVITTAYSDSAILFNSTVIPTVLTGQWVQFSFLHSTIPVGNSLEVYYYTGGSPVLLTTLTGLVAQGYYYISFIAPADITGIGFKHIVTVETYLQLDNISIMKYDFSGFKIFDCCTDNLQIAVLDDSNFTVTEDTITFIDIWENYISNYGYYKICIDDVEIFLNHSFYASFNDWSQSGLGSDWDWTAPGSALTSLVGDASSKMLNQDVSLPKGCEFTINIDQNSGGYRQLDLYLNNVLYTSWITGGSVSATIISKNASITNIGLIMTNTNSGGGADDFVINEVSIVTDICSDCIHIAEEHECSLYVTATQTNDAFGFEFDGTFVMYQRLFADLFKHNPEYEQVNLRSSYGITTQIFGDLKRFYDFKVYRIPGYLWEALEIMIITNTLTIDGIRYVKNEGSIELDWDNRQEYASGTITLINQTENNQNTYF